MQPRAGVAELVDAGDLKSPSRKGVQVRVLPPAYPTAPGWTMGSASLQSVPPQAASRWPSQSASGQPQLLGSAPSTSPSQSSSRRSLQFSGAPGWMRGCRSSQSVPPHSMLGNRRRRDRGRGHRRRREPRWWRGRGRTQRRQGRAGGQGSVSRRSPELEDDGDRRRIVNIRRDRGFTCLCDSGRHLRARTPGSGGRPCAWVFRSPAPSRP